VGRVSQALFTFEYNASAQLVRGVYLPVTLTCASTYCVLKRPWAAYFELTWERGDPVHIGTALGGF